ncbi:MAG: malonyl-CoA/methylmalonyl-CoA synthetase [Arcticibacterium sp.]|jgi:malonyl-CoA/methylmalonyl-CoA synthetase
MIQLIENAEIYLENKAVVSNGTVYTYKDILDRSESIALKLLGDRNDLQEARIAFIVDPGFDYVAIQWGIWRAGGIAVPLCVKHPFTSLEYVINDIKAERIIYSKAYSELISGFAEVEKTPVEAFETLKGNLPNVLSERRAMILYTSGTTGSPKGVVTTHDNIEAQIKSLVVAWEWSSGDYILNVLPLHHIHGIINATSCPLWTGACIQFVERFDPKRIFEVFVEDKVNIFMAVPTIYFKLIAAFNSFSEAYQKTISDSLMPFRLMVSGSAALPISILEQWKVISGHILLERYGMTEMGMAISNSYNVSGRRPGYIGQALPNIMVRLADEKDIETEGKEAGEIQIKGPNVFHEYWKKPEATEETFTKDGWFKTGDIAVFEEDYYRILGRNSVDIIKSGGYKISALEIEEVLRTYPGIKDCAVVGIEDEEWGELVAASLIANPSEIDLKALNNWLKARLPNYKMPRKYIFQEDLPRNVMGKVTKKELKKLF